jgi:predicted acetyltransferase
MPAENDLTETERQFLQIELRPATREDEPLLANLLELYAHDFSEFSELKIGSDGRFGYEQLPLYWKEAGRFPFLVIANGSVAGFVLVQQGSRISIAPEIWDIAEFFILRGYRRAGVGLRAAHCVWRSFPGSWQVRVIDKNLVAQTFWQHAVSEFTELPAESAIKAVGSKRWRVFSLTSPAQSNTSSD